MGSLLSKSSKRKQKGGTITETDKAVLNLKTQRRKLEDQRKRLEDLIDKNVIVVRTLVTQKKKDRAMLALKKKRMREDQLKNLDNWLISVEGLLNNIEAALQQNRVVEALKQGAQAVKEIQKEVTIEDVEKLMEDTAEAREYQEQIEGLLGESLGDDIEDELTAELARMEDEILQGEIAQLPTPPKVEEEEQIAEEFPAVPTEATTSNAIPETEPEMKEEPVLVPA